MSSSAPNTQGQITVAELANDVGARIVDAYVSALEASCAIGCLNALPTAKCDRVAELRDARPCTCHPDDNPPQPCAKQYALGECMAAAAHVPNGQS